MSVIYVYQRGRFVSESYAFYDVDSAVIAANLDLSIDYASPLCVRDRESGQVLLSRMALYEAVWNYRHSEGYRNRLWT